MVNRLAPAILLAALLAPRVAHALPGPPAPHGAGWQAACPGSVVTPDPVQPRQGALFRVRVEGASSATAVRGHAAGEPLHFDRHGDAWVALAAAPIDAPSPLRIVITCPTDTTVAPGDSVVTSVPLARADYPLERLTVAPRFSAAPDSALAARMRRESALAADVSRLAHETPRLWSGAFTRPRESRVTSTFGSGREFNGTVTSRHMGTDYAGAVGAPVRAANRGVVRLVDRFFLGGNVVYIDHGAGLVTAYLHLSEQAVAVGDTVEQGEVIGTVGATGRVTGPHLHWITRYGAITVDPATVLRNTREP